MEYYTTEIKKELLPFATAWMELESNTLSEISQMVKDKYQMISPVSRTQSTKQTRKQNITRDIEIKIKLKLRSQEGDYWGKEDVGHQGTTMKDS